MVTEIIAAFKKYFFFISELALFFSLIFLISVRVYDIEDFLLDDESLCLSTFFLGYFSCFLIFSIRDFISFIHYRVSRLILRE